MGTDSEMTYSVLMAVYGKKIRSFCGRALRAC